MSNSIVCDNTSVGEGGAIWAGGFLTITNSVFYGNTGSADCVPSSQGATFAGSGNIIGSSTCAGLPSVSSDDPLLIDRTGETGTRALSPRKGWYKQRSGEEIDRDS